MARKNDKRIRLIEAANELFHRQGVNNTTLANIASRALVPLGNVYYYFKSKESIIVAVIERRIQVVDGLFSEWEQLDSAKDRLKSFVDHGTTRVEEAVEFGDSLGSLCQELGKETGEISDLTAELLRRIVNWNISQFQSMGYEHSRAEHFAANLISSLQGVSLLALTFKDADYIERQHNYLKQWIESL